MTKQQQKDEAWELYEETIAPALKLYNETEAPARKLFEETTAPARKLCNETEAPALKLYEAKLKEIDEQSINPNKSI